MGEWRDDKQDGHGLETWADGSKYQGENDLGLVIGDAKLLIVAVLIIIFLVDIDRNDGAAVGLIIGLKDIDVITFESRLGNCILPSPETPETPETMS